MVAFFLAGGDPAFPLVIGNEEEPDNEKRTEAEKEFHG
jgi:hypothetical protein